jgi:hypothetical protein
MGSRDRRTDMVVAFEHRHHPRVEEREKTGPPKIKDEHVGINGKIRLYVTTVVGTMWCVYAFAALALFVLSDAIKSPLLLVQWISQTFIELVMLSVIIVGQNIQGRAAEKRAEMTFEDAAATLHGAEEIQRASRGSGRCVQHHARAAHQTRGLRG